MKQILAVILLFPAFSFSQQTRVADFKSVIGKITINPVEKSVSGNVSYDFEILKATDTIKIDAHDMAFTNLKLNGKDVQVINTGKQLKIVSKFRKSQNKLTFEYRVKPRQTMYFTGSEATDNLEIWTQGQGKYTSFWFPSFDDVNEKLVFGLSVSFSKNYEVIANGILESKTEKNADLTWNYQMKNPMSSYLLMVAIGKFQKQEQQSNSGIPLAMYLQKNEMAKFEPTYRYSKAIFDFLEQEIGVKYQWEIYKQVPVHDFLYGGMENTSATIFAQDYVVDETGYNDRNYFNVNAHELAHQWFGDLITAKSGKHHWLQEGFATYYALLAEKEILGEDDFYWKMYQNAEELQQAAKTDTIPILNEKASSLSFYEKGAWALHVLREGVGAENFKKAVKSYLEKYQFKNVETADFLAEINKVSDYDTKSFQKRWLERPGFEVNEAINLLKKNKFMQQYFDLIALQEKPFAEKQQTLIDVLKSDANFPLKEEAVFQTRAVPFEEKKALLMVALQTNDIQVRQAVANTTDKIPTEMYGEFVQLLDDKSYLTKEIILGSLWKQFPEKQLELLEKTKNEIGFNDKNVRIEWLTLALMTKSFPKEGKLKCYDELLDYTTLKYESRVRQNAITNLLFLNPNDTNALEAVAHATVHHKWQFVKFGRDKIRSLIKKEKYKTFYTELLPKLSESEKAQVDRILKE